MFLVRCLNILASLFSAQTINPTEIQVGIFGKIWSAVGFGLGSIFNWICDKIYIVCKWLMAFMDFLQYFIQKLIGLDYWLNSPKYTLGGALKNDLLFSFLYNDTVQKTFRALVGLSIVLLIIFTIFAIIRSEWAYITGGGGGKGGQFGDGSNSKASIIRGAIKAITMVIIFPLVLMMGIISSDAILASLVKALNIDTGSTFGAALFNSSTQNANKYRNYASGSRLPINDEITFYMYEDGSTSKYMYVNPSSVGDSKTYAVNSYEQFAQYIADGKAKKYTVTTMFEPINPSETSGFSGYCVALNIDGTTYYYLVKRGTNDRDALRYYLNNVLQVKIIASRGDGNSTLYTEIKSKATSYDADGYISNCNLTGIRKGSELAKAAYNTWGYLTTYMNSSIAFDSSVYYVNLKNGSENSFRAKAGNPTTSLFNGSGEKSLMEILGFGTDTSAKIMFNSNTISSYFDGGQFGLVQLQSEYYVMSDVVDFIAESGLRLYMVNANSKMIRWNYDNYQISSAWIGHVDESTGSAGVTNSTDSYYGGTTGDFGTTTVKTESNILYNKIPLMVSYSNIANDIEAGNTLYLADANASSEKDGAVYIMCLQVPEVIKDSSGNVISQTTRYIPLLNNTTYTDSITQKTYRFSSSYYTNNYKGVVIARGLLDNSENDPFLGYPTYIQEKSPALSGVDVSDRRTFGKNESEYYYNMELAGSINSYVDTSSYSNLFGSYDGAGKISGYLGGDSFTYWTNVIDGISLDSVLYNNTNINNFKFSDDLSVGGVYIKNAYIQNDDGSRSQLQAKNVSFAKDLGIYLENKDYDYEGTSVKSGDSRVTFYHPNRTEDIWTRLGNAVLTPITVWSGALFGTGVDNGSVIVDMPSYNGVTVDSFNVKITDGISVYDAVKLTSDLYYIKKGDQFYIFKLVLNRFTYSGSELAALKIEYETSLSIDDLDIYINKGENTTAKAEKYSNNIYKANFDGNDYFFTLSSDDGKNFWSWLKDTFSPKIKIDNKPSTFIDNANLTPVISYNNRTYRAVYDKNSNKLGYYFNVGGNYYAFDSKVEFNNGKINFSIKNNDSLLDIIVKSYNKEICSKDEGLSNTQAVQLKLFTSVDSGKKIAFVQLYESGVVYLTPTDALVEELTFKASNLGDNIFTYNSKVYYESSGLTIYSFRTKEKIDNFKTTTNGVTETNYGYIFIKVKNNSNQIYLSQYDSFAVGFEDVDFTNENVILTNKPAKDVLSENEKTDSVYINSIQWIGDTSTNYKLSRNGKYYSLYRVDNGQDSKVAFDSSNLSNISIVLGKTLGSDSVGYIATYTGIYNGTIALYSYTNTNKVYYLAIDFSDGNINPMTFGDTTGGNKFIALDNDDLQINTVSKEFQLAYNYYIDESGTADSKSPYKIGNMSASDFNNSGKTVNGYTLFTTADKVYIEVTGKYDYLSVYFQNVNTASGGNGLIYLGTDGSLTYAKAVSGTKIQSESAYYKFYLYDFYSGYITDNKDVYSYKNGNLSLASYNADKTITVFVDKNFNWEKDSSSYALYNGKEYIATIYKNYGTSCDSASDIPSNTLELLYNYRTYYNIQTHNSYKTQDEFKNHYDEIEDSFIITFNRTNAKIDSIWDFSWLGIFNGFIRMKVTLGTYKIQRDVQFKSVAIKINSGIAFDYFFDDEILLGTFYSPTKISYWVIIFASVIIIKVLATAIWGVIKRFYEITLYFLAMPIVASTIPLDDGQRFKQSIQKPIFDKVLGTYGVILGLNVFFVLLTPIRSLSQVFTAEDIATSGSYFLSHLSSLFNVPPSGVAKILNNFVYILFMLVAFTMIETLPATVSKIIGIQGDVYGDGKQTKDLAKKQAKDTFNTISGNNAVNMGSQIIQGAKNMGIVKVAGAAAGMPFKTLGKIRGKFKEGEDSAVAQNAGAENAGKDGSKPGVSASHKNVDEEMGGGDESNPTETTPAGGDGSTGGDAGNGTKEAVKEAVKTADVDNGKSATETMGFVPGAPQTQIQKDAQESAENVDGATDSKEQFNRENSMTMAGGENGTDSAIAETTKEVANKVTEGTASSQEKNAVKDAASNIVADKAKEKESSATKASVDGIINSTTDDASNADKLNAMHKADFGKNLDKKDKAEFDSLFDKDGNLKTDDASKQKQKQFLDKYQFGTVEKENGEKALTIAKLDKKGNAGEAKEISNDISKKVVKDAEQKQAQNKPQESDDSINKQINAVGNASAGIKQEKLNAIRSVMTGEQRSAFDKQFEGLSDAERAKKEDEVLQQYEFEKKGNDLTVSAKDGSFKGKEVKNSIANQIISKASTKASDDKAIDDVLNGQNGLMKDVSTATKFEAVRSTLSKQERDELDAKTKGKSGDELEKIQSEFLKDYKLTGTQDENGKISYVAQKQDKNGNIVSMKKVGDDAQSKIAGEMLKSSQISTSEISNAVKADTSTSKAINNSVAGNLLLASNETSGNLNSTLIGKLDKMEGDAASVTRGKAIADALGETDAGRGIRNRILKEMGVENFDEIKNDPEKMNEFAKLLDKKKNSKEDLEYSNYLIDHDKEYSEKLLQRGKEAARKGDIAITAYDIATDEQKEKFKEDKAKQKATENLLEGATEDEATSIISSSVRKLLADDVDGKAGYTKEIANRVFANNVSDNELDGLTEDQIRKLTGNKSYKKGGKLSDEDRARIGYMKKQFNVKHASDIDFTKTDEIKNNLSTFENKAELSKQVQQLSDKEISTALNKNPSSNIMKTVTNLVSKHPEYAISELQKLDIDSRQKASIAADIKKEHPELSIGEVKNRVEQEFNSEERIKERQKAYRAKANSSKDSLVELDEAGKQAAKQKSIEFLKKDKDAQLLLFGSSESIVGRTTIIEDGIQQLIGVETEEDAQEYIKKNMAGVSPEQIQKLHDLGLNDMAIAMNHKKALLAGQIDENSDGLEIIRGIESVKDGNSRFDSEILSNMQKNAFREDATQAERDSYIKARDYMLSGSNVSEKSLNEMISAAAGSGVAALDEENKAKLTRTIAVEDVSTRSAIKREIALSKESVTDDELFSSIKTNAQFAEIYKQKTGKDISLATKDEVMSLYNNKDLFDNAKLREQIKDNAKTRKILKANDSSLTDDALDRMSESELNSKLDDYIISNEPEGTSDDEIDKLIENDENGVISNTLNKHPELIAKVDKKVSSMTYTEVLDKLDIDNNVEETDLVNQAKQDENIIEEVKQDMVKVSDEDILNDIKSGKDKKITADFKKKFEAKTGRKFESASDEDLMTFMNSEEASDLKSKTAKARKLELAATIKDEDISNSDVTAFLDKHQDIKENLKLKAKTSKQEEAEIEKGISVSDEELVDSVDDSNEFTEATRAAALKDARFTNFVKKSGKDINTIETTELAQLFKQFSSDNLNLTASRDIKKNARLITTIAKNKKIDVNSKDSRDELNNIVKTSKSSKELNENLTKQVVDNEKARIFGENKIEEEKKIRHSAMRTNAAFRKFVNETSKKDINSISDEGLDEQFKLFEKHDKGAADAAKNSIDDKTKKLTYLMVTSGKKLGTESSDKYLKEISKFDDAKLDKVIQTRAFTKSLTETERETYTKQAQNQKLAAHALEKEIANRSSTVGKEVIAYADINKGRYNEYLREHGIKVEDATHETLSAFYVSEMTRNDDNFKKTTKQAQEIVDLEAQTESFIALDNGKRYKSFLKQSNLKDGKLAKLKFFQSNNFDDNKDDATASMLSVSNSYAMVKKGTVEGKVIDNFAKVNAKAFDAFIQKDENKGMNRDLLKAKFYEEEKAKLGDKSISDAERMNIHSKMNTAEIMSNIELNTKLGEEIDAFTKDEKNASKYNKFKKQMQEDSRYGYNVDENVIKAEFYNKYNKSTLQRIGEKLPGTIGGYVEFAGMTRKSRFEKKSKNYDTVSDTTLEGLKETERHVRSAGKTAQEFFKDKNFVMKKASVVDDIDISDESIIDFAQENGEEIKDQSISNRKMLQSSTTAQFKAYSNYSDIDDSVANEAVKVYSNINSENIDSKAQEIKSKLNLTADQRNELVMNGISTNEQLVVAYEKAKLASGNGKVNFANIMDTTDITKSNNINKLALQTMQRTSQDSDENRRNFNEALKVVDTALSKDGLREDVINETVAGTDNAVFQKDYVDELKLTEDTTAKSISGVLANNDAMYSAYTNSSIMNKETNDKAILASIDDKDKAVYLPQIKEALGRKANRFTDDELLVSYEKLKLAGKTVDEDGKELKKKDFARAVVDNIGSDEFDKVALEQIKDNGGESYNRAMAVITDKNNLSLEDKNKLAVEAGKNGVNSITEKQQEDLRVELAKDDREAVATAYRDKYIEDTKVDNFEFDELLRSGGDNSSSVTYFRKNFEKDTGKKAEFATNDEIEKYRVKFNKEHEDVARDIEYRAKVQKTLMEKGIDVSKMSDETMNQALDAEIEKNPNQILINELRKNEKFAAVYGDVKNASDQALLATLNGYRISSDPDKIDIVKDIDQNISENAIIKKSLNNERNSKLVEKLNSEAETLDYVGVADKLGINVTENRVDIDNLTNEEQDFAKVAIASKDENLLNEAKANQVLAMNSPKMQTEMLNTISTELNISAEYHDRFTKRADNKGLTSGEMITKFFKERIAAGDTGAIKDLAKIAENNNIQASNEELLNVANNHKNEIDNQLKTMDSFKLGDTISEGKEISEGLKKTENVELLARSTNAQFNAFSNSTNKDKNAVNEIVKAFAGIDGKNETSKTFVDKLELRNGNLKNLEKKYSDEQIAVAFEKARLAGKTKDEFGDELKNGALAKVIEQSINDDDLDTEALQAMSKDDADKFEVAKQKFNDVVDVSTRLDLVKDSSENAMLALDKEQQVELQTQVAQENKTSEVYAEIKRENYLKDMTADDYEIAQVALRDEDFRDSLLKKYDVDSVYDLDESTIKDYTYEYSKTSGDKDFASNVEFRVKAEKDLTNKYGTLRGYEKYSDEKLKQALDTEIGNKDLTDDEVSNVIKTTSNTKIKDALEDKTKNISYSDISKKLNIENVDDSDLIADGTRSFKVINDNAVESRVYANVGKINNEVANNAVKAFSSINTEKQAQNKLRGLKSKNIDIYELRTQASAIGVNSDIDLAVAYEKALLSGKINSNSTKEEITNAILTSNSAETNQLALSKMLDSTDASKKEKVHNTIHNSLSNQEKSTLARKLEQDETLSLSEEEKNQKIIDLAKDSGDYDHAEREAKKEKILEETKQNLTLKEKVDAAKNNKEFKDRFKREYKTSGARNIDEFYQMFEKDSENAQYVAQIEHDASLKKLSQQDADKNGIGNDETTFKSNLLRKTLLGNAEFRDVFRDKYHREADENTSNKELFDLYNARKEEEVQYSYQVPTEFGMQTVYGTKKHDDIVAINDELSAGLKEYRKKTANEKLETMLDAREQQGVVVNVSKEEVINKLGKDKVANYETKVREDIAKTDLFKEETITVNNIASPKTATVPQTTSNAKTRDEILNEYKNNPDLLRKAKEDYARKKGITLKTQDEVGITVSNDEISEEILNGKSAKSQEIRQKIKDSRPNNKKTISEDAIIDAIKSGKTDNAKTTLDLVKASKAKTLNDEEISRVEKENQGYVKLREDKEFAEQAIDETVTKYNRDADVINKQNENLKSIADKDRDEIRQRLNDSLYTVDKKGNKIKNAKYETKEFKDNYNKFIDDYINHGHIGSFDQFQKLGINDMELYNRITTDKNEKELNNLYNTYVVSQTSYNRGLDAKKNLDDNLKANLRDNDIKRFMNKSIISKYGDTLNIAFTQDEINKMNVDEIKVPELKQPKLVDAKDVSVSRDDIREFINIKQNQGEKDAVQAEIIKNNYDDSDVTKEEVETFMGNRDNSTDVSDVRKEIKQDKETNAGVSNTNTQKTYTATASYQKARTSHRMSAMQIKRKYELEAKKKDMVDTVYKTEGSLISVDQLQQSFAESDDKNSGERATKMMNRLLNGSGNADDIDLSDASSRQLDEKTRSKLLKKAKADRNIQLTAEELKKAEADAEQDLLFKKFGTEINKRYNEELLSEATSNGLYIARSKEEIAKDFAGQLGKDEKYKAIEKAKENALVSKYVQENDSALYETQGESKADAKTEKIKKMAMGVDGTDAVIADFARANKSDYNRIITEFQKTHQGVQFSELDVTEQNKYLASKYQNNVSNELVQNKYLENLVKKGVIKTSDGTTNIVDGNGEINADAFKQLKNNLMKEKGNMTIEQYLSSGKADKYLDQKSTREYVEKVANKRDGSLEKLAISKMDSSVFSSLHKKISSDLTDETNDIFEAEKKAIVEKKVEQRLTEGKVNPISVLPDTSKMTERENREFSATKIMLSNQIRENTNPAILKNILNNTNLVNEDQILRELAKAQNIDIKAFENADNTINKTALMQVLNNDTVNNYFNKNIEMRDTMLSIGANDLTTTLNDEQRKQKNIDAINSNENLKNEMLLERLKTDEQSHNININNRILLLSRQKTSISSGEKNDIERDVRNSLKKELIAEMKRMNPNKSEQEIAKSISDKKLDEYIKTRKVSDAQIMSNVLSPEELQNIATDVRASNAGKSETEIQSLISKQVQESSNVKIASMFGINTDGLNAGQVTAEIDKLKSSGEITNGLIDQKLRVSSKQSNVVERKLAEQNNMYISVTNKQVDALGKDYKLIAENFGIYTSKDKLTKSELNKALVSADRIREIEGDIREHNNGMSDAEISKLVDSQVEKEANEKIASKFNIKAGSNAVNKKLLDQKIYNDAMKNEQETRLEIAKAEYTDSQGNIKKSARDKISQTIEKEKNSTNLTNFRENLYEQVKKNISYTANMSEQDLTQFLEAQEIQKSNDLSISNGIHGMGQDIANFFTGIGSTIAGTPHAIGHEFKGAIYHVIRRTPGNSSSYDNWNKAISNQIAEVKQGLGSYKDMTREQRLAEIDKLQDKLIFTGKSKPANYSSMNAEEKRAWTNRQTKLKAEAFASKDFSYIRNKQKKVDGVNKVGRKKFTDNFGYTFGFQGKNVSEGIKEQHKKDLAVMKSKITEYNATKGSMNFGSYSDFSAMAKKFLGDKLSTDKIIDDAKDMSATERAKLLEEAMAKKYKIVSHRVAHDSGLKRKDFLEERGIGETVVRYKDATKKYTALKSSINTHLPIPGINALVNTVAYQTKKGIVNHYDKNNGQVNRVSKFMYDRVYGLRYGDSKAVAVARKNNLELGMKRIEQLNLTFKGTSAEYAKEIDKILGADAAKVYGKHFKLYNRDSAVAIQKRGVLKTLNTLVEKENRRINYKSNVIPATNDSASKFVGQTLTNSKTAAQKATDKQIAEELSNSLNIVLNQKSISSFDAVYARLLPQIREQFENRKFGMGRSLTGMTDTQKFAILENYLQKKLDRANNRVQNNSMLRNGTEQLEKLNGRYYKSSELERSKISPTMVNAVMNSDARYKELTAKFEEDNARYLTEKQNRDHIQNELTKLIEGPRNSYTKLQIQTLNENLYESNTKLKVLKTALNKSESMKKTFELAYAQRQIDEARKVQAIPNAQFGGLFDSFNVYQYMVGPDGRYMRDRDGRYMRHPIDPHSPHAKELGMMTRRFMNDYRIQVYRMRFALRNQRYVDYEMQKELTRISKKVDGNFNDKLTSMRNLMTVMDRKIEKLKNTNNRDQLEYRNNLIEQRTRLERIKTEFATSMNEKNFKLEEKVMMGDQKSAIRGDQLKAQIQAYYAKNSGSSNNTTPQPQRPQMFKANESFLVSNMREHKHLKPARNVKGTDDVDE